MKLQNEANQTIVRSHRAETMKLDSKKMSLVFDWLRNKIYSDKPMAVVREYLANATDEHVKYNVTRPVEIEVSTTEFSVRDFGLGLSEEDVFDVYFSYLASTKNESDDPAGGFGIGSKSGHCYGDRFFVTSYFGGKATLYAGILETIDGMIVGRSHVMSSVDSDEPTGIKVSVPLRPYDHTTFLLNAKKCAIYSSVPVLVNGEKEKTGEVVLSGKNWKIFTSSANARRNSVIVSNVRYDITTSHLTRPLCGNVEGAVLYCSSGDVDVPLSRESLEFTDKTKNFLTTAFKEIEVDSKRQANEAIEKNDGFWEKMECAGKFPHFIGAERKSHLIPRYKYSYIFGKKERPQKYGHKTPCKENLIYHRFNQDEKIKRGFLLMPEHVTSVVFIQDWKCRADFDKALKENEFWEKTVPHQKLILEDVVIPEVPRKKRVSYQKKPVTDVLSEICLFSGVSSAHGILRMADRLENTDLESFVERGGYYVVFPRRLLKKEELQNFKVNIFNLNTDKQIACVTKKGETFLSKKKGWKPFSEMVEEFSEENIRAFQRKKWAERLLGSYYSARCRAGYTSEVTLSFSEIADKKLQERIEMISLMSVPHFPHHPEFIKQVDEKVRTQIVRIFRKSLKKSPNLLYSLVGAKVMGAQEDEIAKIVKEITG